MPEMHLTQPRVTYSACGPFTKNKEKIQKINKKYLEMNKIKLALNMIGLTEISKIRQEE